MKRFLFALLFILTFGALLTSRAAALNAETVRLPITRDLWISSAHGEEDANNGATPRLKVKGYQEFSILDFDVSAVRGKRITKATLHLKLAGEERLYRVGVSSLSAEWIEGSGVNYAKEEGVSTFRSRISPDVPWFDRNVGSWKSYREYNDITSVMFGQGGSVWSSAESSAPENGWQTVAVDPDVVAMRAAGLSYGFVVFDDTGTELEKDGDAVTVRLFPNRFFYSRDQNRASEPYLEVEFIDGDTSTAPESPHDLTADVEKLPLGDAIIRWTCNSPVSDGIIGFAATLDGSPIPQATLPSIPRIGAQEGRAFEARLSGIDPKKNHRFELVSVNRSGVKSEPAVLTFTPSTKAYDDWQTIVSPSAPVKKKTASKRSDVRLGSARIAIADEFIKFTETGETVPSLPQTYFGSNAIWNAESRQIQLKSAKNEFIGFQVVFFSPEPLNAKFSLDWNDGKSAPQPANFYRLARVETAKGQMADPAAPIKAGEAAPIRKTADSVYCEVYVPSNAAPGVKKGALRVQDGNGNELELPVELTVWNFKLPNELSFFPEMNCYSLPSNERDYYRMAQLHRTYINRVPYSHRGSVGSGLAPVWNADAQSFDWSAWEKRFGPYFDGSAFADLPRGPVPVEFFYLPLFENFPANIFEGFKGVNDWPEESAFTREYLDGFAAGCKEFARKISDSSWDKTHFLFFLNNKMDYKKNGWSNASSPWLLDEPASFRDFSALKFYGDQLEKALAQTDLSGVILYRADISRPQWERDSLDSSLDVYVVGGGVFRDYRRAVLERSSNGRRIVYTYGTTAAPSESAYQPTLWSLDAWTLGADGIVPWQTIGNDDSWRKEDELSLFYPATSETNGQIVPSIRLKSYRRGEQDVEYLTLLVKATGRSRDEIGNAVRARLDLDKSQARFEYAEDAGTTLYQGASPDSLETFRRELGDCLDRLVNERK